MLTRNLTRRITQALTRKATEPGNGGGDALLDAALALSPVFLYDHKDITSFFSDSAMTTQAVVDGPVGAVRDSSGNGRHRRQTDNAKRPTLRQSGSLYYIEYNGTSHFLVTDAIDLTGTNVLTLCWGVTKSSDAASGIVVEVGTSISSATGIALYAPTSAGTTLGFGSRGTATVVANYNNASVAAPITRVLTGVAEISTDTCILRSNGVQIVTTASDQGTGNYANSAVYFGARGGASTFFSGRDYGGALYAIKATGANLTAIEAFTADRTGVTL